MERIKVEIVADSVNSFGNRLTSLVLTYPRIIHSEMMTHRMFSRNASSSRAVPVDKMIKAVRENTFCPFEFQKSHKGMQGSEYFTGAERQECINLWLESAELALQQAEKMKAKGISKQIINRILEPYQYYTVLITGSREGWQNFFELRCPSYLYDYEDKPIYFKSKKNWVNYYNESQGYKENSPDFTKVENLTDLEWLQFNKGQAEIHMMVLAEKIYDAMNESIPIQLKAGEWHIPMISDLESVKLSINNQIKLSVGRAANTSYTVIGDGKELTLEQAVKIHDKCKELNHSSVFEHCARAMSDEEYISFIKGKSNANWNTDLVTDDTYEISAQFDNTVLGWCNNFRGFIQYRYLIENNEK